MSIQSPLQSTADPPAAFQSLTHTLKKKDSGDSVQLQKSGVGINPSAGSR